MIYRVSIVEPPRMVGAMSRSLIIHMIYRVYEWNTIYGNEFCNV